MTTSTTSARNIAIIAISLVIAVGCGEPPIDDVGANPPLGQETGAQAQPDPGHDFDVDLEHEGVTLDNAIIDVAVLEALPEGDGNAADHGFDIIEALEENIEAEEQADVDGLEEPEAEASNRDGFSDGDATGGEWKSVAKATCRMEDAELVRFEAVGQLSNELYRGATFVCYDEGLESEEIFEGKYRAIVMGGQDSCKSYETFRETANRVCGSEASILSKKVFNSCADSDGQAMYESALFVCKTN